MAGKIEGTTSESGAIYIYKADDMSLIKSESVDIGSFSITDTTMDIINVVFVPADSDINMLGFKAVQPVTDYNALAVVMCKNIQTGDEAYFTVENAYAPDLATLVTQEYITSYTLSDTGAFNYYVSGNGQFAAWWEGSTRTVSGTVGRYTHQYNYSDPIFRDASALAIWIADFPT